jgi:EAL domain-containing protein (putative c-di-GMP-specific phosphodiesterase class I)
MKKHNTVIDKFIDAPEWNMISDLNSNTGLYRFLNNDVILDANASYILLNNSKRNITYISYETFNETMEEIKSFPVEDEPNIYIYNKNGQKIWLKLSEKKIDGQIFGVIQNVSDFFIKKEIYNPNEYDPITHLLFKDTFISRVRNIINNSDKNYVCCLASVRINGINHFNAAVESNNKHKCSLCLINAVRSFQTEKMVMGINSYKELYIFFDGIDHKEAIKTIKTISDKISQTEIRDDFGQIILSDSKKSFSLSAGLCDYPFHTDYFPDLFKFADFALYECAIDRFISSINVFSNEIYEKNASNYINIKNFYKLINENLFQYHFQPIFSASTGDIFGYEALMRTPKEINMTPLQILEFASKHDNLYSIEKHTFFNTLKIISEHQDILKNKKLFINSIPNGPLNDEDFDTLSNIYDELFSKIVIEIIENQNLTDESIFKMHNRMKHLHFEIAIDDFGSGFSNSETLIRSMPNYIKIDRSLISDIDKKPRKQQLVSNIIQYANTNNIRSLAEGIETEEELKTVLNLGVELVQGYFTSRPKPFFLEEPSKDVKDLIQKINLEKNITNLRKIFTISTDGIYDILNIALYKYTDIYIQASNVQLIGNLNSNIFINLIIADNCDCNLSINDLVINSITSPVMTLGENSNLTLIVNGKNKFSNEPIIVPSSASITFKGNGTLDIITNQLAGSSIGNYFDEDYGNITIEMDGNLNILSNGHHVIAIGGGRNKSNSKIQILAGDINIEIHGTKTLGIGSVLGNADIKIKNCELKVVSNSVDSTVIGSISNDAKVEIEDTKLIIECNGNKITSVGVIEEGSLKCEVKRCHIKLSYRSSNGTGIGAKNGNNDILITHSKIYFIAEGTEIIGLGNEGSDGFINIYSSHLIYNLLAANPSYYSLKDKNNIIIDYCKVEDTNINNLQ